MNVSAHRKPAFRDRTTGPEVWNDTDGEVAAFVAGPATYSKSQVER